MSTIQKLGAVLLALIVASLAGLSLSRTSPADEHSGSGVAQRYVEIVNPSGFVNTGGKPIKIEDYIGEKVILLDIMTYSCINCQRTFPYVTAWYEKYRDEGLIVIGIHTPEFAFEKDIKNVEEAMQRFGIEFPIVLDNEYATWNALGNRYWPRKYLIDIHGNIVYDHIGEGAYEETERKILELLAERAEVLGESGVGITDLVAQSIPEKRTTTRSPETYFGALRNEYLGNGAQRRTGTTEFTVPVELEANKLYLGGTWELTPEHARSAANSRVVYPYYASEVYLVAQAGSPVEMEVWQDGVRITPESAGADVSAYGTVEISESRLYKLVKNPAPGAHTLELRLKGPGAELYAFTFG